MAKESHVCSPCGSKFGTEQEYLDHVCDVTGATPKDIEHQDALTNGQFSAQSEAALKRGEARKTKK